MVDDSNTFAPDAVTVRVGGIVEWDYRANGSGHNIVFPDAAALSNNYGLGHNPDGSPGHDTWQAHFTAPGTYHYVCTFHKATMTGTVTVS
jgi:plastocyanin